MKIAILSFYSGIYQRGVERWTYELANRLTNRHEIVVYQNGTANHGAKYKISSEELPFNIEKKEILVPLQKRAFFDYKSRKVFVFALRLIPKLWKENFDIIIPTDGGWEPAIIRILTWIKRKKMIIVGHAGIGWDDKNNLWSFPNVFVALSSYAKSWAKKVNPLIKIKHIPDGVDINKFNPKGDKLSLKIGTPTILTVGALTKEKRIDLIIKAVSKIESVSLLIVGEGKEKGRLQELGEELLGDRFLIKQFDFDEMPKVYRSADLFVSASLPYFSFEMVLLESMATNLPVVANDDSIRREIIGNAGYFADPSDTNSFAEKIDSALKKEWKLKPRKQATKFSWDEVVIKYRKLFEDVVKTRSHYDIS